MSISSKNRAWIAASVLLCVAAAGIAILYHSQHRPLPPMPGIATNPGPPPDILSQLPPDAPVVAYLDAAALRKLQNSPLSVILGLTSPGPETDREYADFVRDTGFDYTRDLDHAAIAFWPVTFGTADDAFGEDRVLAIAGGRFDEEKIKTYCLRTGKAAVRGTQSVYEIPGDPPISLEFLSKTRIALAGGRNATNLLDAIVPTGNSSRDSSTEARIKAVAGAPIFAVARTDHLPSSFYANFRNFPQLEHLARSVRAITVAGQPDGNNVKLVLDAECDSLKNAFELSTLLEASRMAGSMALYDPKTRSQMTNIQAAFLGALINKAKITHQDKWVRLSLEITPALLNASKERSAKAARANGTKQ